MQLHDVSVHKESGIIKAILIDKEDAWIFFLRCMYFSQAYVKIYTILCIHLSTRRRLASSFGPVPCCPHVTSNLLSANQQHYSNSGSWALLPSETWSFWGPVLPESLLVHL